MRNVLARTLITSLTLSLTLPAFADFKYTEKSKVTGGAMTGAVKMAGIFSKDARQMTNGINSTTSIKGNRMRRENDLGTAEIYDLDGRRVIQIDSRHKTYSIVTFDEMKAQLEEQQRKAEAQQSKSKDPNAQVKITPKIQMSAGSNTKQLLGLTAKETKMRAEMEMQSQDPKHAGETGSFWYTMDAYVAPVKGYDELKNFNMRMAKDLNWVPGSMANATGGNVQIAPAMVELQKDALKLNGMPLLQYVNFGVEGNGQPQQAQPEAKSSTPSSASGAIAKGIGGLFGKKKKKEDEAAQQTNDNSSDSSAAAPSNSLMNMTIEVTSVSSDPVDASLFDIPQGYKKVDARNTSK